jgi:hypothetical protein
MKRLGAVFAFLLLAASLYGQSVVELSRREKARRQELKGRQPKVVTNADLAALKKTPAVTVTEAPAPGQEASSPEAAPPGTSPSQGETPPNSGREDMVPAVTENGPPMISPEAAAALNPRATLEAQYKAACGLVDTLTSQMNLLWQQFYNLNNMQTQGHVQQQIDETYQKLLKAQADQARLKAQLDASPAPRKR